MAQKRFAFLATVSTDEPAQLGPVLDLLVGAEHVALDGGDFHVSCSMEGESAKELNRALLSALRRVVKRTRLRSEWTADGVTERFFDYVSKGTRPTGS